MCTGVPLNTVPYRKVRAFLLCSMESYEVRVQCTPAIPQEGILPTYAYLTLQDQLSINNEAKVLRVEKKGRPRWIIASPSPDIDITLSFSLFSCSPDALWRNNFLFPSLRHRIYFSMDRTPTCCFPFLWQRAYSTVRNWRGRKKQFRFRVQNFFFQGYVAVGWRRPIFRSAIQRWWERGLKRSFEVFIRS